METILIKSDETLFQILWYFISIKLGIYYKKTEDDRLLTKVLLTIKKKSNYKTYGYYTMNIIYAKIVYVKTLSELWLELANAIS